MGDLTLFAPGPLREMLQALTKVRALP